MLGHFHVMQFTGPLYLKTTIYKLGTLPALKISSFLTGNMLGFRGRAGVESRLREKRKRNQSAVTPTMRSTSFYHLPFAP